MSATDGPFAETKELIGGYLLIEAKDRAEAVRVAARIPGARIGLDQIKEGDQVRASFDASGNQASKIEVTSKQKAGDKSEMKTQSKDK